MLMVREFYVYIINSRSGKFLTIFDNLICKISKQLLWDIDGATVKKNTNARSLKICK